MKRIACIDTVYSVIDSFNQQLRVKLEFQHGMYLLLRIVLRGIASSRRTAFPAGRPFYFASAQFSPRCTSACSGTASSMTSSIA